MLDRAERIGLSPTPCGRRVKRLEDAGVILGHGARISPTAFGLGVSILVSVRLVRHKRHATKIFAAIAKRTEITECLLITGNIDYMLPV